MLRHPLFNATPQVLNKHIVNPASFTIHWALASNYFKEMIEDKINCPMNPRGRGGNKKSECYKSSIS